ncbi:MAG: hypothetical protein QNJ72_31325 [Pleurocapsa sp. MO_226.B13]|nr:hypothetical protein [Pleurocapsa sp. MO_226.B13]
MSIIENWTGYFLNHLLPEDHELYSLPYTSPNNIDWKLHLKQGISLRSQLVTTKHLYAGKIFWLDNNPESEEQELLDEPIKIIELKYEYGEFEGIDPQKQDAMICGVYREKYGSPVEIRHYKTLPNPLTKPGAKDKIVVGRRVAAKSWIKQRAREIDRTVSAIFTAYGEEAATNMGLKQLNLTQGIESFFEQFDREMSIYLNSGNLSINSAIESVLTAENPPQNPWLKEKIPIDKDAEGNLVLVVAGEIIKDIFAEAIEPVTQTDIDAALTASS